MQWRRWGTHAEDDVQVTGDVYAHSLHGHPTPFVCALRYVRETPAFDFYGTFRTVWNAHGLWDNTVPAARFAELIEQFEPIVIRRGVIL